MKLPTMATKSTLFDQLIKVIRFIRIYGPGRALTKVLGRLRIGRVGVTWVPSNAVQVGFIGCGQFAFSTIAYYLRGSVRFVDAYDLNPAAAKSLGKAYGFERIHTSPEDLIADQTIDLVYVASNHASHAPYAISALAAGKDVFVEKPVAISHEQFTALSAAVKKYGRRLFVGYNRPFSPAIRDLKRILGTPCGSLTLSCFISGHVLDSDHWYRRQGEGTRICGNVGHWIDLAIHLLYIRGLPDRWRISQMWSDDQTRDENLAITLTSEQGDLVNIVLTARTEPFEGINETINLQWDCVIAKIDDFRKQTIWKGRQLHKMRYWPKDVGHRRAILQPLTGITRPWSEIEDSTLLMLKITEMVREGISHSEYSVREERARVFNGN